MRIEKLRKKKMETFNEMEMKMKQKINEKKYEKQDGKQKMKTKKTKYEFVEKKVRCMLPCYFQ